MQEVIAIRGRTFEIHWEPVQVCGRVQGCKHGNNTTKNRKQVLDDGRAGVSAYGTRRAGWALPDASEAPNRKAQNAQHTQHA